MTRRAGLAAVAALALSLPLAACSTGSSGDAGVGDIERSDVQFEQVLVEDATEAGNVVKRTRELGLAILGDSEGKTTVLSPASAVIAIAMLGATATGETEEEMTLLLGAAGEERDRAVNALSGTLDAYRVPVGEIDTEELPDKPQLHLANQVVLNQGFTVEKGYLDALQHWYDAGVLQLDLATAEAKGVLDAWVKENTAGLVEKSAMEPDASLRLILQNAIVFAAGWQTPFRESATAPDTFHLADGSTVTTDFMNGITEARYATLGDWAMLELPFRGGDMVARFILPPQGIDPQSVTPGDLAVMELELAPTMVNVTIPKLDLKTTTSLGDSLMQQGLTSVFSVNPPALDYIAPGEDLEVSEVIQQAAFQMDEKGTVAAAVTEVMVAALGASAPMPAEVSFRADRPYLIIINDTTAGWDLFQVAVEDPVAQ